MQEEYKAQIDLKPSLVIYSIYNGYWFWGRPSITDLWHDPCALTSEIRPDWDLRMPGLREPWTAGDFSVFHGVEQASRRENRPGRAETGMTAQLYTGTTRSRRTSYKCLKNRVQCATLIGTRGAAGRKNTFEV